MALIPVGSMTIGAFMPTMASGIIVASGDAQARLTAMLAFSPTVTMPTFDADISVAADIGASLGAAMSFGLTPPSIGLQVSIMQTMVLELRATIELLANLLGLFAVAGVDVYAYDGATNAMGAEVAAQFASEAGHANALVLVARESATWSAMQLVFKTSP